MGNDAAAPTRRQLLKAVGALAVATGTSSLRAENLGRAFGSGMFPLAAGGSSVTLKDKAAQKGIIYGSNLNKRRLDGDPAYANLIVQQDKMIVPATEMKWMYLRPSPTKFNFDVSDSVVHWAQSHGLLIQGTTLVWHQSNPGWFDGYATKGNAKELLVNHITTVAKRYAGKIHSWVVVNEAVKGDELRDSPWLGLLGPDYIELSFRTAAEADPAAILIYNDNNTEFRDNEPKREEIVKLLDKWVSKKVPVQALGIQSHLRWDTGGFDAGKFRKYLNRVADLGLQIHITELEAAERDTRGGIERRDRAVADDYYDFLSTALEQKATKVVMTWGLTDRYSNHGSDRRLPFDENFKPKPVVDAMLRAFDNAAAR
jgi:endo-1,4-beta-xylanase